MVQTSQGTRLYGLLMVKDEAKDGFERAEVMIRFRENLGFLVTSARHFDSGVHAEALRLAMTVRNLSYEGGQGDSILTQIGAKPGMRWQSYYTPFAMEVPEGTPVFGSSLYGMVFAADGSTSLEPLDFGPNGRQVSYDDWWTGEPVIEVGEDRFTRKQLVLGLANQDGGGHVDLTGDKISALFANSPKFLREDGTEFQGVEQRALQRDLLQTQMRTVANEVFHSIRNAAHAGLIPDLA